MDPTHLLGRRLRRIFLAVVLGAVLLGASLVFMLEQTNRMSEMHSLYIDSVNRIRLEVTLGHLWFEEFLTGADPDCEQLSWAHFASAEQIAQTMLDGQDELSGDIRPLQSGELRAQVEHLRVQLDLFEAAARQRLQTGAEAAAGSPLDQQFDEFFESFLQHADILHSGMRRQIESDLKHLYIVQRSTLVLSLLLAAALAFVLYRYETRRVDTTRQLAASEQRYRAFFESAAVGIIISDKRLREIRYANPALLARLGYEADELLGLTIQELHPESVRAGIAEKIEMHDSSEHGARFDLPFQCKDGSVFPAEIQTGPLQLDGRPHVIGFVRDLTDEKAMLAEKERLEDQLRQAQKMEAVGNLAGGIAHDFNNLLQAILGYSEILHASENMDEEERTDLERIRNAADRAADLTRQLLAFSRRQVISPQDVDMNTILTEILAMLQRLIGEGIDLAYLPGNRLGTVCVDRTQFEQVVINLCLNARDAMDGRGKLTLETENVSIDDAYCEDHLWAQPGRYVLLSVTDTGVGIDPDLREHIFEPFFTTKETGKGTGLGLSTVYGMVKQNSGLVHVYSEVGRGTTFKIYFPLVERPAQQVGDKITRPVPTGTETILIAEDDPGVLSLATRVLKDAGYSVLTANNGEEALEVYRAHRNRIDLALLDVVMPGRGGREVQDLIRQERPDFKVVFASGYSENAIHTDFILHDGRMLIQKPYRRDDLLYKIRDALDE